MAGRTVRRMTHPCSSCGIFPARQQPPLPLKNAQEAAQLVLEMAQQANAAGTFGVAGAIIENSTGRVIARLRNRVLGRLDPRLETREGETYTFDPTAHGERQLVQWYYDNKKTKKLPEPFNLTIVTSLDPCAMCTGALLTAGFNVGVVAIDDWAGINFDGRFAFSALPETLRRRVQEKFGYYAVEGHRPYVGGDGVAFRTTAVEVVTHARSLHVFLDNVLAVRDNSQGSGVDPATMADPALLPDDAPLKRACRSHLALAFTHKLTNFRAPDATLQQILSDLVDNTPQAGNAVALIDPFGNLLVAVADRFDRSPLATAFMNAVQAYSTSRFQLLNDPTTSAAARERLTHPKYGTFVFLHAPTPGDSRSLMDLGAYGSTMEGAPPRTTPGNLQYYLPPVAGSVAELAAMIKGLPPFYSQTVGIAPEQVGVAARGVRNEESRQSF